MNISDFYTSEHSEARKLPLLAPNNTETDEFLMIIGYDSNLVREAKAEAYRLMIGSENKIKTAEDAKNIMRAAMIESWSFKTKCTLENKLKFLCGAPYLADAVDLFSSNHENFKQKK